jgi:hypothetical protein
MTAEIDAFATAPAFEATASPYLIVDRNLCICAVNEAYESATAHPREVLLGERLFDVFPNNPADPDADGVSKLTASLETVLRTGTRHRMSPQRYDVPDRSRLPAFRYKVWSPINSPIRDERGRTIAVLHHVEDVTDFFPLDGQNSSGHSLDLPAAAAQPIAGPDWASLLRATRHQRLVSQDLGRQVDTLREALNTNRQISVAIGLLMAATGINRDAAFQLLLAQSQSSNRKLRDVAADLVTQHERGALPAPGAGNSTI